MWDFYAFWDPDSVIGFTVRILFALFLILLFFAALGAL